jgi:hypothetical protein
MNEDDFPAPGMLQNSQIERTHMTKYFNLRRFCFVFLLLMIAFSASACSAAWIGALQGLIPTIEGIVSAVVAFVAALNGKTISAAFNAKVQQWGSKISDLLTQLSNLVTAAGKSATSTVIAEIQAVMSQLSQSLGSILADTGITDAGTIAKIEELAQLAIAAVNAVLAVIPVALARIKAGASTAELESMDSDAKDVINNAHKVAKNTYHVIVTQQTSELQVNEALATLPQSLK